MLPNRQRILWVMIALLLAVAFWALDIELTYERNIRRGIPADFRIRHSRSVYNSKA
jgi:hypothetical protein